MYTIQYIYSTSVHFQIDVQVVATTIGSDLTPQIEQVILNHYSHNLHYGYETTINYNLKLNYAALVM